MPSPLSTADLIDLVRKSGILPAESLDRSLAEVPELPTDPAKSAAVLVRHGVLTTFQAKLLLAGRYRGFRVGPYVIRDQLGQGGMGTVYLAEHATLRRRVAIKVLSAVEGEHPVAVERFVREARAAAALDHPNIVRIFDIGQTGSMHYLVMEHVDGQTLDKLVQQSGPIACGRAVEYVTQAAAGLQHAYEKGFVHRDIKPANLMLARDGTVKILDMGLARSFNPDDKLTEVLDHGAVVGTADYISPEQAMNSPDLDIRADLYSLGASFFTLVTGRPPFEGNTTQKLLQHQMKSAPALVSIDKTFPPGLSAVVERMLAKTPGDRFQTPAELIAALTPWLPGSDKVLAGITRTDMARSPELQNTLNEMVSETTKRLTRRFGPAGKKLPVQWHWLAVGVVTVVVLGLIVAAQSGVFKSGNQARDDTLARTPEPAPPDHRQKEPDPPKPRPSPPAGPALPVAPAPKAAGVVYDLDLTGRGKFAEKGRVLGNPDRPNALKWQFASQTGSGLFPPGWKPSAAVPNGAYDGAVTDADGGGLALVARPVGSAAAALLGPEVPFPSAKARVRVTYRTEPADGQVAVRFYPTQPRGGAGWTAGTLGATGGEWKTKELNLDLKGATEGRFAFVAGAEFQAGLAVKGFTAIDPVPAAKKALLRLDTTRLKPFVQRTRRFQQPDNPVPLTVMSETGPGKMPSFWFRWIEFDNSVAEFFAEGAPGTMVLGIRNVEGLPGVQINTPEVTSRGGRVRVLVLYHTGLKSPGAVIRFRPTRPKGAIRDVATLPPTGGSWRAQVIDVDLKGATAGLFELYNAGDGPDAALRFREFVVTDAE
ncbi:MAG TPA: serine/threonine-protein kinase [Fimbriiglobus sp.]|nr:serine/threonine-protein kinase [Fimbriiglobus sp.]